MPASSTPVSAATLDQAEVMVTGSIRDPISLDLLCGWKCHPTVCIIAQVTGLATTFNSTALKATIFLPKNEAFAGFLSSLGLQMDQILNTSSFTPYLGQVRLFLRPGSTCRLSR